MKSAQYYGPGDVRVEEIPEPEPKSGQVKVKIAWNGICGSDLHAYLKPMHPYATKDKPNPVTGETAPVTLGHEFSGTIVSLGEEVGGGWKVGQNVIIEPAISCQKHSCGACQEGARNICPSASFIGISGWGGGLAEYIAVDTKYLHLLPDGISLEVGAMIEPLAVAWYAVKRSRFRPGQTVFIAGAGPIGIFLLKVVRSIDPAATIIVSEPSNGRRSLAVKHGASVVINPLDTSTTGTSSLSTVLKIVSEITNDEGVDVSFDAAGIQASLDVALRSLRTRGQFVNVAVFENEAKIDMNLLLGREIHLTGIMAYTGVHPEVIDAVATGKIQGIEELITKKIGIQDVVEHGIMALLHDKESQVKILVHP